MYIDHIKSTPTPIKSTTSTSKQVDSNFDTTLDAATIIYAKPDSGKTPDSVSHNRPLSSPQNMESLFEEAANTYHISADLLKAVAKAESNFNPNSTSSAGAMGIMQLMPETAKDLGVTNAYDPQQNIQGAAKLLSRLLKKYNGDLSLSLAAYNAGEGNVERYGGIPPFSETQHYVSKILGYLENGNTEIPTLIENTSSVSDITTIYAQAVSNAKATNPITYTIAAAPADSTSNRYPFSNG